MTDVTDNIKVLKQQIPSSVKLIAVSKTKPASEILRVYLSGHKCFGENRVQELLQKKDVLPSDIEWHLIGHLQSNKVKSVIPFVRMIHSVDSFKLLQTINSEAEKVKRCVDCLLQIYIAEEETKFGFTMDEIHEMFRQEDFKKLSSVRICGVMGIATFTDNIDQVRKEFRYLVKCQKELKRSYFEENDYFREISMGMSGDYKLAIEEGSTMVRIGSLIFGTRT